MTRCVRWLRVMLLLSVASITACVSLQRSARLPAKHPDAAAFGHKRPLCTECHDARGDAFVWKQFDHTSTFGEKHKRQAYQHEEVCAMCHQGKFCSDCHGNRVELKPSLKNQSSTFRRMPHRGGYLARHRIDGRVDPASCARCHGNPKTAESCVKCHG